MGQLFYKVDQVLQSGARANTKWISNFLKFCPIVIANGAGVKKWDNVITKWDNYFKEVLYIFVKLQPMQSHTY